MKRTSDTLQTFCDECPDLLENCRCKKPEEPVSLAPLPTPSDVFQFNLSGWSDHFTATYIANNKAWRRALLTADADGAAFLHPRFRWGYDFVELAGAFVGKGEYEGTTVGRRQRYDLYFFDLLTGACRALRFQPQVNHHKHTRLDVTGEQDKVISSSYTRCFKCGFFHECLAAVNGALLPMDLRCKILQYVRGGLPEDSKLVKNEVLARINLAAAAVWGGTCTGFLCSRAKGVGRTLWHPHFSVRQRGLIVVETDTGYSSCTGMLLCNACARERHVWMLEALERAILRNHPGYHTVVETQDADFRNFVLHAMSAYVSPPIIDWQ